jgi:hypothetical protein
MPQNKLNSPVKAQAFTGLFFVMRIADMLFSRNMNTLVFNSNAGNRLVYTRPYF